MKKNTSFGHMRQGEQWFLWTDHPRKLSKKGYGELLYWRIGISGCTPEPQLASMITDSGKEYCPEVIESFIATMKDRAPARLKFVPIAVTPTTWVDTNDKIIKNEGRDERKWKHRTEMPPVCAIVNCCKGDPQLVWKRFNAPHGQRLTPSHIDILIESFNAQIKSFAKDEWTLFDSKHPLSVISDLIHSYVIEWCDRRTEDFCKRRAALLSAITGMSNWAETSERCMSEAFKADLWISDNADIREEYIHNA